MQEKGSEISQSCISAQDPEAPDGFLGTSVRGPDLGTLLLLLWGEFHNSSRVWVGVKTASELPVGKRSVRLLEGDGW